MDNKNSRIKKLNIGTLNVRGCKEKDQKETVIKDALKYNLDILSITETHIKEELLIDNFNVVVNNQQENFTFFSCNQDKNSYGGIGFIIKKELNPTFRVINNRICQANITIEDRKLIVICTYAPTLQKCEKYPEIKEEFYSALQSAVNKVPNRNLLFLTGDFNSIVGSGHQEYPEVVGKYSKGILNNSGRSLLEFCSTNNLTTRNCFSPKNISDPLSLNYFT